MLTIKDLSFDIKKKGLVPQIMNQIEARGFKKHLFVIINILCVISHQS